MRLTYLHTLQHLSTTHKILQVAQCVLINKRSTNHTATYTGFVPWGLNLKFSGGMYITILQNGIINIIKKHQKIFLLNPFQRSHMAHFSVNVYWLNKAVSGPDASGVNPNYFFVGEGRNFIHHKRGSTKGQEGGSGQNPGKFEIWCNLYVKSHYRNAL